MGSSGVPVPVTAWTALPHWTEILMGRRAGPSSDSLLPSPAPHTPPVLWEGLGNERRSQAGAVPSSWEGQRPQPVCPSLGFRAQGWGREPPRVLSVAQVRSHEGCPLLLGDTAAWQVLSRLSNSSVGASGPQSGFFSLLRAPYPLPVPATTTGSKDSMLSPQITVPPFPIALLLTFPREQHRLCAHQRHSLVSAMGKAQLLSGNQVQREHWLRLAEPCALSQARVMAWPTSLTAISTLG